MPFKSSEVLTSADVKVIAASLYEPLKRIWLSRHLWRCPQCRAINPRKISACSCGITRDGLPEFRERA